MCDVAFVEHHGPFAAARETVRNCGADKSTANNDCVEIRHHALWRLLQRAIAAQPGNVLR